MEELKKFEEAYARICVITQTPCLCSKDAMDKVDQIAEIIGGLNPQPEVALCL